MAQEIPTKEPTVITAGETVEWRIADLTDFRASEGWILKYYIRGPKKIDLTAAADNDAFLVSVAATTTATWTEGFYRWQAEVSQGALKHVKREGALTIKAGLAAITADGYEARSQAKIAYDACLAALASWRSSGGRIKSYVINDTQVQYTSSDEIKADAAYWYSRMTPDEKKADRHSRGKTAGNTMKVRFK